MSVNDCIMIKQTDPHAGGCQKMPVDTPPPGMWSRIPHSTVRVITASAAWEEGKRSFTAADTDRHDFSPEIKANVNSD